MSNSVKEAEAETFQTALEYLQQDQRPRRPCRMTPGQARIYQMAALFRAAAPGATAPDPDFVIRLEAQLERAWHSRLSECFASRVHPGRGRKGARVV